MITKTDFASTGFIKERLLEIAADLRFAMSFSDVSSLEVNETPTRTITLTMMLPEPKPVPPMPC